MALTVQDTLTSNVTLACDDEQIKAHTFQYNLNTAKTKKKIYEGALRGHYEREEKQGCVNLIFSGGAFYEVVQKAIIELYNGPKHFVVGKENVERVSIDPRKEHSGKHVDTKIEFKVNKDKIVIHIYNTTQKLTIQGRRHKWFVDNYLEPFLKLRISKAIPEIELLNKTVLRTYSPKVTDFETLSEENELIKCDKCDYRSTHSDALRKHIVDEQTVNLFYGLEIETTQVKNTQESPEGNISDLNTQDVETSQQFSCDECDNRF